MVAYPAAVMLDCKPYTAEEHEAFKREIQREVLKAFGLKPWHVSLAPIPRRIRIWNKITGRLCATT